MYKFCRKIILYATITLSRKHLLSKLRAFHFRRSNDVTDTVLYRLLGYEPANLTVHPPKKKTVEGGFIFFV